MNLVNKRLRIGDLRAPATGSTIPVRENIQAAERFWTRWITTTTITSITNMTTTIRTCRRGCAPSRTLLTRKGLIDPAAVDRIIDTYETKSVQGTELLSSPGRG